MPEGLTLNGLSLNNGTTHFLTELQLPIPAKKPEWVEGADADGAILYRNPLVENGTLVAKLDLFLATKDLANAAIGAIVDQLEEADLNPAGIPVVWTPVNGTKSLTFYALSGEVTELPMDGKAVDSNVPTIQITLKCRPGGYGALVTGPSQTTAGPTVQLTIPDIPGDMPTDEAYIVITDTSSQARRHVEWGAEWLHYNASTSLLLDSDSLTITGYSGTQATYGAPMYDPNATGTDSVAVTAFPGAWTSSLSTGSQAHIGTFRVKARVVGSAVYGNFRLAWKVGDGALTFNDEVYVACPSANQNLRELDLGLVTIPGASAGTQSWEGILQVESAAPTTQAFNVDYILLIPVEAGYGRARGEVAYQPGVVSAYDLFNQTAGALNAKTANLGGTWATSVSATDFQVTGSGAVTRTTTTESAWGGRYAILGSTNYTNSAVSATFSGFNPSFDNDNAAHGVMLRWVDANNWLAAFVVPGYTSVTYANGTFTPFGMHVVRRVGGGTPTLLAQTATLNTVGGDAAGATAAIELGSTADGQWAATLNLSNIYTGGDTTTTLTGYDSNLVTGATLDDGKPGFYSEHREAVSRTITVDNFLVQTIPTLAPAIYSGRTLEVTAAEVRRQNSAGTIYARPASYRGSRFVLNPEGSASRTTRILAKAHRNDVDIPAEATPVTDSLKVQVFYRPRYSVVPR